MTGPPPKPPAGTAVGPLAQEAAMLLDVVADRLEQLRPDQPSGEAPPAEAAAGNEPRPTSSTAGQETGGDQEPAATEPAGRCPECGSVPGAYCTACPLCRFMALLRGERPEATARLVDGALMIIRTLRSLVPEPGDPATDPHSHPHQAHPPAQPAPARRTGLEHINIL
jgi:hypothetical protein